MASEACFGVAEYCVASSCFSLIEVANLRDADEPSMKDLMGKVAAETHSDISFSQTIFSSWSTF